MKKFIGIAALLAAAMAAPAAADSMFDGTWKGDLASIKMPTKPDVYLLQNGTYECKTCVPAVKIKADGMDQKISGNPYVDSMAIKVVDDHTIQETDKKNGKVVATSTTKVSADGKTLSFQFTDSSNTSAAPVTGNGTETLITAGPKSSHAVSGSWRNNSLGGLSENGMTVTYKSNGVMLSMSNPTGQSYEAMTDGMEAPYKGDPGINTVSVKMMGKDALQETYMRKGKIVGVAKMKVAADGKSMSATYTDKMAGRTFSWMYHKQ